MVDDVPVFVFLLLLIARNDLRPAHTKGAGVVSTVHRILYSDQVTYFCFPMNFCPDTLSFWALQASGILSRYICSVLCTAR